MNRSIYNFAFFFCDLAMWGDTFWIDGAGGKGEGGYLMCVYDKMPGRALLCIIGVREWM